MTPVTEDISSYRYPPLCYHHDDATVRSIIHSMLRMVACSASGSHVISPCYRSNDPVECKNHYCPYVIGHSIYLWVGKKLGALHKGEEIGVGCTYKHEGSIDGRSEDGPTAAQLNKRAYEIRKEVHSYLEKQYGEVHFLRLPPLLAMQRVRTYYELVIRKLLEKQLVPTVAITSRDLTSGKVAYATIYKSDDGIFAVRAVPVEEPVVVKVVSRMSMPLASDRTRFPDLPSVAKVDVKVPLYQVQEDF